MFSEDYKRGVCLDDLNVGLDWNALFNTLNIHPCQFYLNVIVVNFRDNIDCDEDSQYENDHDTVDTNIYNAIKLSEIIYVKEAEHGTENTSGF